MLIQLGKPTEPVFLGRPKRLEYIGAAKTLFIAFSGLIVETSESRQFLVGAFCKTSA